jgi:hypothetical protein
MLTIVTQATPYYIICSDQWQQLNQIPLMPLNNKNEMNAAEIYFTHIYIVMI